MMIGALLAVVGILGAPPELNDQTIEHWRDYIRPSAQELSFLEIPWRDSFNAAVKEAENRPAYPPLGHERTPAGLHMKQRSDRQAVCLVQPRGQGLDLDIHPSR